jgi:hypothetical protein
MPDRSRRFLAFVDFLGTRELYADPTANAALIEDRRFELEHAIHIRLQDVLAAHKIEIGLFSDTVLIAGDSAATIIQAATQLLDFSFAKNIQRNLPEDIRQLRGGISAGIELRAGYLPTSNLVHTIPFFDGSLAFAYELEGLRRGSRLFLDLDVVHDLDADMQGFIFHWQRAPGFGRPVAPLKEVLWPALASAGVFVKLEGMLTASFSFWRHATAALNPSPERYRQTLYHWDETIKIIIRSFTAPQYAAEKEQVVHALARLLPSADDPMRKSNVQYLWGIWFQVFFVIALLKLQDQLGEAINFTVDELRARSYYDKFVAESDYLDYSPVKSLLSSLA